MRRFLPAVSAGALVASAVAVVSTTQAEAQSVGFTIGQCNNQPDLTATVRRFDLCNRGKFLATMTVDKKVVGRLKANVTLVGAAPKSGSRTVKFTLSLSKIVGAGALAAGGTLRISMPCTGPACKGGAAVTKPIATWKVKPQGSYKFTAPLGANAAKSAKGKTTLRFDITAGGRTAVAVTKGHAFRCDKASYNGKSEGCVFPAGQAIFEPSLTDAKIRESSEHIAFALIYPGKTRPDKKGKKIPGANSPLHRVLDKATRNANRDAAVAACRAAYGRDYATGGKHCDEFPFAATKEGAAKGDRNFSVKVITGPDNSAGGSRLSAFFTQNRVLNGDPFYVRPKA